MLGDECLVLGVDGVFIRVLGDVCRGVNGVFIRVLGDKCWMLTKCL